MAATGEEPVEPDKQEDHAWLEAVEAPDLYMRSGTYTGPAVQVHISIASYSLYYWLNQYFSERQTYILSVLST